VAALVLLVIRHSVSIFSKRNRQEHEDDIGSNCVCFSGHTSQQVSNLPDLKTTLFNGKIV